MNSELPGRDGRVRNSPLNLGRQLQSNIKTGRDAGDGKDVARAGDGKEFARAGVRQRAT
jgi:hypothetical protein